MKMLKYCWKEYNCIKSYRGDCNLEKKYPKCLLGRKEIIPVMEKKRKRLSQVIQLKIMPVLAVREVIWEIKCLSSVLLLMKNFPMDFCWICEKIGIIRNYFV